MYDKELVKGGNPRAPYRDLGSFLNALRSEKCLWS